MASTTNYNWSTPDDTALVKDGASAIRTLGSSIDTTVKNLNPETTLGDISYRSSTANTNTRLAIGTSGQVLTVSGGVPTWAAAVAGGLTLIDTKTLDDTVTNYTFNSVPGGYKSLLIVGYGLQSASTGNDYLKIQFNGDSASNYLFSILGKENATFYGESNGTTDSIRTGFHFARSADISRYRGMVSINIPQYDQSQRKGVLVEWGSGSGGNRWNGVTFGNWDSTSAITSIRLESGDGVNLKAGIIKLYGVS
jgi:hypothetical protein